MRLSDRPPYSYRDDPAVPPLPDGPVAVMDGDCALCTFGARWIARLDRRGAISIAPASGRVGAALLGHYGLDPQDPDSWLFLDQGRGLGGLEAIAALGRRLGGAGWLLAPLAWPPEPLRDVLYRAVARRRRHLFGRADLCAAPDPRLQARLLP
ncbi:MAG: DCC1-like thiol-disulfide oxidoreductase family protein [Pseudomonadota bacterium]